MHFSFESQILSFLISETVGVVDGSNATRYILILKANSTKQFVFNKHQVKYLYSCKD